MKRCPRGGVAHTCVTRLTRNAHIAQVHNRTLVIHIRASAYCPRRDIYKGIRNLRVGLEPVMARVDSGSVGVAAVVG